MGAGTCRLRGSGATPHVPADTIFVCGGGVLRRCEQCGGQSFSLVVVGEGSRRRVDYVPLMGRYDVFRSFEIRALACDECGLVQHIIPDGEVVRSRRDVKDFFYNILPPTRDRNRIMHMLYRHLDTVGFSKKYKGRHIKHVIPEIIQALGIADELSALVSKRKYVEVFPNVR